VDRTEAKEMEARLSTIYPIKKLKIDY